MGGGSSRSPPPPPAVRPLCAPSLARTSGGQDCPAHRWGNQGWGRGGGGRAVSGQAWPTQAKSLWNWSFQVCVCVCTRVYVDWSPARRQVEQRPQPASWVAPQGTSQAAGGGGWAGSVHSSPVHDSETQGGQIWPGAWLPGGAETQLCPPPLGPRAVWPVPSRALELTLRAGPGCMCRSDGRPCSTCQGPSRQAS